jgi:hypothetical protein
MKVKNGKAIPVTGHGGPYSCETSRFPHFIDKQLTDGSETVSLMRRLPFTPREIDGTHFCQRMSQPQDHSADERVRSTEKSNDLSGNRNP